MGTSTASRRPVGLGGLGCGTAFKMTPPGRLITLHNFALTDGFPPVDMIQATDGNLYGTAQTGGSGSDGSWGTLFKLNTAGVFTILLNFDYFGAVGALPSTLLQATDGYLYGMTDDGLSQAEAIYKISTSGELTVLYDFPPGEGSYALSLMQDTNGSLYGTIANGGTGDCEYGCGTVFTLPVGLSPFVTLLLASGKVGTTVFILGTALNSTTAVYFDGTAAQFKIVSPSDVQATVPSGAGTGLVTLKELRATLRSNVKFHVLPVISSFTPESGPPGTVVTITGVSLTGATMVTFGGIRATAFNVDSDRQIVATVPPTAKTGPIGVTTPGGSAASATNFTVNGTPFEPEP